MTISTIEQLIKKITSHAEEIERLARYLPQAAAHEASRIRSEADDIERLAKKVKVELRNLVDG